MASSSILIRTSILLFLLLPLFTFAEPHSVLDSLTSIAAAGDGSFLLHAPADCDKACQFRCSKSMRPILCRRACGACCSRCNCVPPGTSGNRFMCPCYAALEITTHSGKRKCP